jgi:hypothetical protein
MSFLTIQDTFQKMSDYRKNFKKEFLEYNRRKNISTNLGTTKTPAFTKDILLVRDLNSTSTFASRPSSNLTAYPNIILSSSKSLIISPTTPLGFVTKNSTSTLATKFTSNFVKRSSDNSIIISSITPSILGTKNSTSSSKLTANLIASPKKNISSLSQSSTSTSTLKTSLERNYSNNTISISNLNISAQMTLPTTKKIANPLVRKIFKKDKQKQKEYLDLEKIRSDNENDCCCFLCCSYLK